MIYFTALTNTRAIRLGFHYLKHTDETCNYIFQSCATIEVFISNEITWKFRKSIHAFETPAIDKSGQNT